MIAGHRQQPCQSRTALRALFTVPGGTWGDTKLLCPPLSTSKADTTYSLEWKTLCRIKKEAKSSGLTGYITQDPSHTSLFYTQNNRGTHAPACSQGNKTQKGHGTSKCHTTQTVLGRGRSANVSLRSVGSGLQREGPQC